MQPLLRVHKWTLLLLTSRTGLHAQKVGRHLFILSLTLLIQQHKVIELAQQPLNSLIFYL